MDCRRTHCHCHFTCCCHAIIVLIAFTVVAIMLIIVTDVATIVVAAAIVRLAIVFSVYDCACDQAVVVGQHRYLRRFTAIMCQLHGRV